MPLTSPAEGGRVGKTSWRDLLRVCVGRGRAKIEEAPPTPPPQSRAPRAPRPPPPLSSVTFRRGQYQLVRAIGTGAYGDVFLARHPATGDSVAVKRHTRAGDGFQDFEASLRLSRALAGSPAHPLIVRLLDHVIQDAERLTVMELCPSGDLQDLLARLQPVAACQEAEAAFFVLEVAEAVGHLHERGVCHLDVRPCNILLSRRGHCRLADFSICEVRDSDAAAPFSVRLSCRGLWLPPEIQPNRASPAGCFTDWFSLGAMADALTAAAAAAAASGLLSADFRHFVRRLTDRDRRARLGSQRGLAEVLSHGFVARRAARLLRVPPAAAASVAELREFVRRQRLPPPERMLRLLRG